MMIWFPSESPDPGHAPGSVSFIARSPARPPALNVIGGRRRTDPNGAGIKFFALSKFFIYIEISTRPLSRTNAQLVEKFKTGLTANIHEHAADPETHGRGRADPVWRCANRIQDQFCGLESPLTHRWFSRSRLD